MLMDPWRYSTEGISVALRVTPRGGRDDIDGIETLANGRSVVKVRVRAIAEAARPIARSRSCWQKRSACPRRG